MTFFLVLLVLVEKEQNKQTINGKEEKKLKIIKILEIAHSLSSTERTTWSRELFEIPASISKQAGCDVQLRSSSRHRVHKQKKGD